MHVVVFGSTGFLAEEITQVMSGKGWRISRFSSSSSENGVLSFNNSEWPELLLEKGTVDGIVWAQGKNGQGTVLTTSRDDLISLFEANVVYVSESLKALHSKKTLSNPCRAVILSSVWQEVSRPEKFAYSVSKSAISGLVRSVAVDMAADGFSINAVLPGVVDSPMAHAQLTPSSIEGLRNQTPGGELVSGQNVSSLVSFLLSSDSKGINGQSLTVDNGWSMVHHV